MTRPEDFDKVIKKRLAELGLDDPAEDKPLKRPKIDYEELADEIDEAETKRLLKAKNKRLKGYMRKNGKRRK